MKKTKKIIISALLLASIIVLARFLAIRTPIISIGFSFIPVILSAIILGPKFSVIINVLADIIGALLFPSGAYFIGFTISALISGLIYGLLLYPQKEFKIDKKFIIKLIISCLLVIILVHGLMNTLWIMIITKNAAKIIIPTRIVKQLIMFPVQITTIIILTKILVKPINRLKND